MGSFMPYIRPDIDEVLLNFRLILKLGVTWGWGPGASCPLPPPLLAALKPTQNFKKIEQGKLWQPMNNIH